MSRPPNAAFPCVALPCRVQYQAKAGRVSCLFITQQNKRKVSAVSDPTLKGLGLEQRETFKPALTRRLTEMVVAVTEECIGTGGCASKSAALRCAVKQPCEVGAVPYTTQGNPLQRSDGHLTRKAARRFVTYPARDHATRRQHLRCGFYKTLKTRRERRVCNSFQV